MTDANYTLTLTIPENKTVVWKANYEAISGMLGTALLLYGNGTFEVLNGSIVNPACDAIYADGKSSTVIVSGTGKVQTSGNERSAIIAYGNVEIRDHAEINSTTGETINACGNYSTVTVSGGTISATSENAIITRGIYSKVFVSGGVVSNDATSNYNVIYMIFKNNTGLNIILSGTAKIEAKGKGYAIATSGGMIISDNAQVIANEDVAVYDCKDLTVCDNGKIIATTNYAIGSSAGNMNIEIKDNAQVIAHASHAVNLPNNQSSVTVSGGLVFAQNSDIHSVILSPKFTEPVGTGIILAWDKAAGNTTYVLHSATDIYKLPETATVSWEENEEENGIAYSNGNNTGFIPLEVTLTEEQGITENGLRNLLVYPNPTTGELTVEIAGQARNDVADMEIYDVMGKKVSSNHLIITSSHQYSAFALRYLFFEGGKRNGEGG
jgi:hypothetical protein